jgi:hypothetical protein
MDGARIVKRPAAAVQHLSAVGSAREMPVTSDEAAP